MIAAGCANGKIYFFDAQSGEVKRALRAHKRLVGAISWSPCGEWLASGGDDKLIKIWDVGKGEVECALNVHRYTLFLFFITDNLYFSRARGEDLPVKNSMASKETGPGTRKRGDLAPSVYLKFGNSCEATRLTRLTPLSQMSVFAVAP
jgi:WD40 repeat protein